MKAPTVSREGPSPPPSPPIAIRLNRSTRGDAFVSRSPEEHGDENVHWKPLREPALSKNPETEPALPTASLRPLSLPPLSAQSAMPSLAVESSAARSALAPRTDAQANHARELRNDTGAVRKEEDASNEAALAMPGVDVRRSIGDEPPVDSAGRGGPASMTPPRKPSGDTIGSISDLVKASRSFEQQPQANFIPRNPKDSTSPKRRSVGRNIQATTEPPREISAADKSIHSQRSIRSTGSGFAPLSPAVWQWVEPADPDSQEQALFEQRLCEDVYGVAVRKINQNGKSNLRYVKCVPIDDGSCADDHQSSTGRSVSSLVKSLSRRSLSDRQRERSVERGDAGSTADHEFHRNLIPLTLTSRKKALAWGKKKDVRLNVERFVCVRKGKATERTRRNLQPASRLLSLITDDPNNPSLDIEAPTKLDRDKFARAFSKFLGVPLLADDDETEEFPATSADFMINAMNNAVARSAPDMEVASKRTMRSDNAVVMSATPSVDEHLEIRFDAFPSEPPEKPVEGKAATNGTSLMMMASQSAALITTTDEQQTKDKTTSVPTESLNITGSGPTSTQPKEKADGDEGSVVSSLTGAGFDQEIVEELHQALTELRAELEGSRAEAARAVKVAEQAIQSAENSSSKDWNNTVTHKAAEAAALAQKKSAEAMAKQRLAEERLAAERKTAAFWRKQAEAAEEEAGVLQTRAAAAEVQRAAMAEELESERRNAVSMVTTLKQRYSSSEVHQNNALESALETNRSLLIELESTRRELDMKSEEAKILHDTLEDAHLAAAEGKSNGKLVKKLNRIGRKKKPSPEANDPSSKLLLAAEPALDVGDCSKPPADQDFAERVQKLHSQTAVVRRQYELLRRATADELRSLPASAEMWTRQASQALTASQAELSRLRQKLAVECATRRRLLHEVQDLRGVVRVYCRPRPLIESDTSSPKSLSSSTAAKAILSVSSQETLLLHRDRLEACQDTAPLSFEFDGIFQPDLHQKDVYSEMEELVLGVLDGYNVCIMAYGQTGSGKTHSLLGDVRYIKEGEGEEEEIKVEIDNEGIQLQGVKQLFTVSDLRSERYQDVFSLTIVEVQDERLVDLVVGTKMGDAQGRVEFDDSLSASRRSFKNRKRVCSEDETSSWSPPGTSSASRGNKTKLEIRTNHDGDTVVQGLISIPVNSYEDVLTVWHESLSQRAVRVAEQDMDLAEHEASTHVIATLKVVSTNIATGIGCVGKIHFVDLAGADLTTKRPPIGGKSKLANPDPILAGIGNNNEWKFTNKSLGTLLEVVHARCQFNRSVPYRNSTLTHLLRDSLEADTKVLMLVCVSSDAKDVQETASALRLASKMRRVNIGKATKHTLGTSS